MTDRRAVIVLALGVAACACPGGSSRPAEPPTGEPGGDPRLRPRLLSSDAAFARLRPRAEATLAPTTLRERAALEALVAALIRDGAAPSALRARAAVAGWAVEHWQVDGARFAVVREPEAARRGAGAYAVRVPVPDTPVILQAPHAYFDLDTGHIAAALTFAADSPVAVLMVNTVHRYRPAPDRRVEDDSPADVAHAAGHGFSAATEAAIDSLPGAPVIQLHGFDGDAPVRGQETGPAAIVSAGDGYGSSPASTALAAALAPHVDPVARFPEDVAVLGGTQNVQGRIARRRGAPFVHVELDRTARRRLRAEPALQAVLTGALRAAARAGGP